MMDPTIKEKWVAALRSGDYEQQEGSLRLGVEIEEEEHLSYCCLGILCEVINPDETWLIKESHSGGQFQYGLPLNTDIDQPSLYHEYPPPRIQDAANLLASEMELLAEMNDAGETFLTIADHIEENL